MNKVKKIIREDFDSRMENMVISYLISKGIEFCESITEKDIAKVEGNGLMTQEFLQDMIRTAARIARECNLQNDIYPFIVDRFDGREITYDRMSEIASRCVDGLVEDGKEEAYEYFRNEVEMTEYESEYFGVGDLDDEEEW